MNPHERFCHNQYCWAYGRPGEAHIVIHSKKESPATAAKDVGAPSLERRTPRSIASTSPRSWSSWCSPCWRMALRFKP
jgi:hypothetical protein